MGAQSSNGLEDILVLQLCAAQASRLELPRLCLLGMD